MEDNQRMKCQYKDCDSPALLSAFNMWLCGLCFVEIKTKLDLKLKAEINSL